MNHPPDHRPEPITVLDLFAGCGGLTEGFHQFRPHGAEDRPVFRSVGAVEWEPSAAASYEMNFGARSSRRGHSIEPPVVHCGDIVGWTPSWEPGTVDVVVGGPPCQGFSALNRKKVNAERNQLWQEFIRVVEALQPKVFVIENVDRFIRSPEFSDLQRRVQDGDLMNYALVDPPGPSEGPSHIRARGYLLNAADYGSPQARRRAIVVGVRTNDGPESRHFRYPRPTHRRDVSIDCDDVQGQPEAMPALEPWVAADAVFKETRLSTPTAVDLPPRPRIHGEVGGPYLTTDLHITRNPEPVSLARYRAIPPGGNRKDLRGRYLCSYDEGLTVLIKKVDEFRDGHNALVVEGDYLVLDGEFEGSRVSVKLREVEGPKRGAASGRHRAESFAVRIEGIGISFDARLDYLSTASWDAHDAGSGDVMGRVRIGAPSVTIRTEFFKPEKGRYLHPTDDRPITHYEAAKLQGFPDDFRWCGSKTDIARQIGNAVPIPLGRSIASSIYEYLRGPGQS
ncbi:DNA cytosine methyltransferase [Cellulosimicrobium cellulans]|uniref:DNA cytosine methyltransferase n=1 Tax=Cellulosimicrobium cellulans TaxID=1710 RepID=UPI0030180B7F